MGTTFDLGSILTWGGYHCAWSLWGWHWVSSANIQTAVNYLLCQRWPLLCHHTAAQPSSMLRLSLGQILLRPKWPPKGDLHWYLVWRYLVWWWQELLFPSFHVGWPCWIHLLVHPSTWSVPNLQKLCCTLLSNTCTLNFAATAGLTCIQISYHTETSAPQNCS